ncbi:tyrosine-type recombinase/integrase [Paenibacillus sp. IITD108]|uniref:tyrosine-type recombinase/integrase n=1 Tax=Paenibacillus sp. IITD108 TaxID=3116649 RepID=UPI002F403C42
MSFSIDSISTMDITVTNDILDTSLFSYIASEGFSNTDWNKIPDTLLVYLFLHDEPTIGKRRKLSTKKEYLRDLQNFFQFYKYSIREVKTADLLAYQLYLEERNIAPTSLRRASSVIKQFFSYLYKQGVIENQVTLKMKRVAQPLDQLVNRDIYNDEVQQLLDYFQNNDWFAYTLLVLLSSTGLRIDELASAKWANLFSFKHKGKEFYFLKVIGKGDKPRDALIYHDVLDVLIELRKRRSQTIQIDPLDTSAFFCKSNGKHYSSSYLSSEFTKLIYNTNFPFVISRKDKITPHTLRHYRVAVLSDEGIDIRSIQDAMGHASIQTTEKYLLRKRKLETHAGIAFGNNYFNKSKDQLI